MKHLFTSFVCKDNVNDEKYTSYISELIPLWLKINSHFFESVTIVTNVPSLFSNLNINILTINIEEAFCSMDHTMLNPMASQIGCWKLFLNSINNNDIAVYLDPDAFMLTDKLYSIANLVIDHQFLKKRAPFGMSDAGTCILRKTDNTLKFIDDMKPILKRKHTSAHAELYYDTHFKGKSEYFMSWKNITVLLRGVICGSSNNIDCIHGVLNTFLLDINYKDCIIHQKDVELMLKLIGRKEEIRTY